MKNTVAILSTAVVLPMLSLSGSAQAEVSANLGMMSDYFYRGVFQADAVANGGVDFEQNGFYVGTWAADVDDGLEIDVYGGYGFEADNGLSVSAGLTGYYYTGDFDDTYQELNLGLGFKNISVDYAIGEYDNFDGPTQDYDFLSVTGEYNGFYAVYGTFGKDADGDYFEVGYGTSVGEFDLSGAIIANDKKLSNTNQSDESFVLSISKSFDLM